MSKESIKAKLEKVRLAYIETLPDKYDEIQTHWSVLIQDWNEESYKSLYILIHSLAGSAETFGFPDITNKARSIVDYFKQHESSPTNTVAVSQVDTLIKELLELLGAAK